MLIFFSHKIPNDEKIYARRTEIPKKKYFLLVNLEMIHD